MRPTLSALAVSVFFFASACGDRAASPTLTNPAGVRASRIDGAHGGMPGFYFLPPMFPQPATSGTFDPDVAPEVTVCLLRQGQCASVLSRHTLVSSTGGERVQLKASGEQYLVNWNSRLYGVREGDTLRVQVSVGSRTLGFADVVMIWDGRGFANVDADEYIPLILGQTLSIRFRIERSIAAYAQGGAG